MLAIAPPVYQVIYPLGFLVYLYTLKKFGKDAMRKAVKEWNGVVWKWWTNMWNSVTSMVKIHNYVSPHENNTSQYTPLVNASDMGYNTLSKQNYLLSIISPQKM